MAHHFGSHCHCFLLNFWKFAYIYSLTLLLMVSFCYGLYEDQIGLFDWRQRYVGTPKEIVFDQSSPASKRVYTVTQHNVLAALNARTGKIVWRKVFEPKQGVIQRLILNANTLLTVSGNRKIVRSWDTAKGNLLWESTALPYQTCEDHDLTNIFTAQQKVFLDTDNGGVILTNQRFVKMISKDDGTDIWQYPMKNDNEYAIGAYQYPEGASIISLRIEGRTKHLFIHHLELDTGKFLSHSRISAPWLVDPSVTCVMTSSRFLFCMGPGRRILGIADCTERKEQGRFIAHPLENYGIAKSEQLVDPSVRAVTNDLVEVRLRTDLRWLVKIESETSFKILDTLSNAGLFNSYSLPNNHFVISLSQTNDQLNIEIYNADSVGKEVTPLQRVQTRLVNQDMVEGTRHPLASQCTVYMYKKNEDFSLRMLLVSEDYTLTMLQSVGRSEAKTLWRRDESLSTISKLQMIELPPATSASKLELLHAQFTVPPNSGVLSRFINRVKSQIRQIQTYAEQIKKQRRSHNNDGMAPQQQQPATMTADEELNKLSRDQFNLVKIILAHTEGRRLFALHTQSGRTVWSAFLPTLSKDSFKQIHLIEQRSTAHFPLPPQTLLFGKCNVLDKPDCNTVLYSFNPMTGEGLSRPVAMETYDVLKASVLPFEDDKSLRVVGIVDTQLRFHLYPDTADTRAKLQQKLHSIYIHLSKAKDNSFKGYKIRMEGKEMTLYPVWSVNIPSDQNIIKVSGKRKDEVVNSVGRVLGDHTVLYKYLNPNLVSVMSVQGEGVKGSLFVYIIDAVTGHIVYHARHKGGEGPVEMILSEHWLVYLYHNSKGKRNEVAVVELFEGYEEKNNTAFSSLDPIEPTIILSQAYVLPVTGVQAMVSTATERGITNKNILFGLSAGYVYSLPKVLLDPRRQFKQTKMLQEEGVAPYMPELPVHPQAFVNYNQTVENIRGIYTTPAGLESTSLVLVYGLDIYYTRVTPSRMFDVLKEDFDYIFISGVLSALILVSILCSKFASMRNLKLAWA
ncbi:ER membrane protein complex subunit 1-like [Clytia hemisphaerica]|uniref:ER membrane protein complex subunit 1 n=1 Tax=Clytia hemisphaerica TaxID=252671 RepID=A0A7M5X2Y6_9CNID